MIKLHFEHANKKDIELLNYDWSSLFVGANSYKDDDIFVTDIYTKEVPTDEGQKPILIYCFDVQFCISDYALDSVTNEVQTVFFD